MERPVWLYNLVQRSFDQVLQQYGEHVIAALLVIMALLIISAIVAVSISAVQFCREWFKGKEDAMRKKIWFALAGIGAFEAIVLVTDAVVGLWLEHNILGYSTAMAGGMGLMAYGSAILSIQRHA